MAKVQIGDKIRITDAQMAMGKYSNGDVFTIKYFDGLGVKVEEHGIYIFHEEFEVISSVTTLESATIKQLVEELSRRVGIAAQTVAEEPVRRSPIPAPAHPEPKLIRDLVVARAKEDVETILERGSKTAINGGSEGNSTYKENYYNVEFVVNKDKRTVVALVKLGTRMSTAEPVVHRGVAKCDPSDCFNEHIGKAIAVRRAFELDVPEAYLNAPKPEKSEAGDYVEYNGKVYKIVPRGESVLGDRAHPRSGVGLNGVIVDDSGRY